MFFKKNNRNVAAAAIARKLAVCIWHLFKGHVTTLDEVSKTLKDKMHVIATKLGKAEIKALNFNSYNDFEEYHLKKIKLIT